ncbi:MAG: molybdopterin-binding protein [Lacunisphaera sp.]
MTDEAPVIEKQLRESWAQADVIITTGGLGPTCDDRTRDAVASVLGQKLVFDPAIEEAIRARFAKFQRTADRQQPEAGLPFRARRSPPQRQRHGARPVGGAGWKILIMLPGPPNELQPIFTEQVIPRLAARGKISDHEAYIQIRSVGRRRVGARDDVRADLRPLSGPGHRLLRAPGTGRLAASARPTTATAWRSSARSPASAPRCWATT